MRQPKQALIFLYKKEDDHYLYAVFKRKNDQYQVLSGGYEDQETGIETAVRETFEETGIKVNNIFELESVCTIPVVNVRKNFPWGKDVCLVYEYCFAIEITNEKINLSEEHQSYEWLEYDEAKKRLTFDSNKNALFELDYKLKNNMVKKQILK